MLKKFILIFAFLFIAQAIAYCLPGDTLWIKQAVYSHMYQFSITGDTLYIISDSLLQLREKMTGNLIKQINIGQPISGYKITPDGKKAIVGYDYDRDQHNYLNKPLVTSWNIDTGDSTILFKSEYNQFYNYKNSYTTDHIDLSLDGKYLFCYLSNSQRDTTLGYEVDFGASLIYDLTQKNIYKIFNPGKGCFSPTQEYIAIYYGKKIELWNYNNLTKIGEFNYLSGNYDVSSFMIYSPNSKYLASYNGSLDIWDVATRTIYKRITLQRQIYNAQFTPFYNKIFIKDYSNYNYKLINFETGDSIIEFPPEMRPIIFTKDSIYMIYQNYSNGDLVCIRTPEVITSINENVFDNNYLYNIYPNPSTNTINIAYPDKLYGTQIEIFNSMGISLWTGRAESKQIDISKLAVGVYFLRIGNETKMFVKE